MIIRFRLVELQLQTLKGCRSAKDIDEALKKLPESLYAYYERILDSIRSENDRERAQRILQLICVAFQPLTIDQMNVVLTVDFHNEKINPDMGIHPSGILEICSSLIETCPSNLLRKF